MTAPVYRTVTPSLVLPRTQNTAPVLEFNCLYTHDVRRKSKRWQDGFVRFHTFNKRIMLYDIPRNLIGDTHWMGEGELADGDEVKLDKSGVLVQIAEAIGTTETDLTELLSSRKNGSSERGSSTSAKEPRTPNKGPSRVVGSAPPADLKHRNLNNLLGRSSEALGKAALPARSPFELRYVEAENEEWGEGRPLKRQRRDRLDPKNVTRADSAGKPKPLEKELLLWARTSDIAIQKKVAAAGSRKQHDEGQKTIDLQHDETEAVATCVPDLSSDILAPTSLLPKSKAPALPAPRSSLTHQNSSELGYFTPNSKIQNNDTTEEVQFMSRQLAAGGADQNSMSLANHTIYSARLNPTGNANMARSCKSKSGSLLRITGNTSKKQLLCQDQLNLIPKRISSTDTNVPADRVLEATIEHDRKKPKAKTKLQLVKERLDRIKREKTETQQSLTAATPTRTTESIDGSPEDPICEIDMVEVDCRARRRKYLQELGELDNMIFKPTAFKLHQISGGDGDQTIEKVSDTIKVGDPAVPLNPLPEKQPGQGEVGIGKRKTCATAGVGLRTANLAGESRVPQLDDTAKDQALPQGQPADRKPADDNGEIERPVQPESIQPSSLSVQPRDSDPNVSTSAVTKLKRIPGASMRYTLSPRKAELKQSMSALVPLVLDAPNTRSPSRTSARKPPQSAVLVNTAASGTEAVMLARTIKKPKSASPAVDKATAASLADPWSREAFDLLDWRPPGWEERQWCFKRVSEGTSAGPHGCIDPFHDK